VEKYKKLTAFQQSFQVEYFLVRKSFDIHWLPESSGELLKLFFAVSPEI
jgi:hypothetical protein